MFSHNMIPTINRPTRVTRNTATATERFITNTVLDTEFKSGIIQTIVIRNGKIVWKHGPRLAEF